jgi:hypothetical protein
LAASDFADRWSVEDTFRNVKRHLGAERPQSWKDIAPERAGAFPCLAYGAVWMARVEREGELGPQVGVKNLQSQTLLTNCAAFDCPFCIVRKHSGIP